MKRNWLCSVILMAGIAFSSRAALPTQFVADTNDVPANSFLRAIVFGGTNFVAVGTNSTTLAGGFEFGQNNTKSMPWVSSLASSNQLNLFAVTYGINQYVATGSNNVVFSSDDGLAWTQKTNIFLNTAEADGIAFKNGAFVAVAAAPQIYLSTDNLTSWHTAKVPQMQFLDTFRAVTAFTNGFAACGTLGLRIASSDGGSNWINRVAIPLNSTNQLDFFGIASDGSEKLVCVGTNRNNSSGSIFLSTDGGTNWNVVSSNSPALHAIAYAGDGFVAVGDHGAILTSPDGLTWTNQTQADITNNFYGVAFATNGLLNGIGVLVGDGGNVVLAGTPPLAPTNVLGATNCEFTPSSASNPPLFADVVADSDHPAGTVTVDWFTNQIPTTDDMPVTNNSNYFYPPDNAPAGPNTPAFYTYYAQTRDLRTGITSTNRTPVTLRINPRPRATVSGSATICNGGSTVVQAALTGMGPWVVTWSANGVPVATNSGVVASPAMLTVAPVNANKNNSSTVIYTVSALSDANCTAEAGDMTGSAVITINPRPTATLVSLDQTNCNDGSPYLIQADLTGISPWTVTWWDGAVSNYTVSPATRTVYPTNIFPNEAANYYYWISNLFDLNCAAEAQDLMGTNKVTINPRPTSELQSYSMQDCNYGHTNVLTEILTGLGPWTVVWSSNGVPVEQVVNIPGAGPYTNTLPVIPTNTLPNSAFTNVYYVLSVSNNGTMCTGNQPGDITGQVSVIINPRPTSDLLSFSMTNCNEGDSLTLTNVLTGLGPWTVTWSSNSVLLTQTNIGPGLPDQPFTNLFTVVPTNTLTSYSAFTNVYFVQSVSNSDTCQGNQPGDITGQVKDVINPLPPPPTNTFGNVTSCVGITPPPLTVTVISGATADWFDATTNLLQGGTLTYIPTNTVAGTYTFYVQTRDPNTTCTSPTMTPVVLTLEPCTNEISGIKLSGTNAIVQWYGDFVLQSATNLAPPVQWTNLIQGNGGVTNYWTNHILSPPTNEFFRLYAPTN